MLFSRIQLLFQLRFQVADLFFEFANSLLVEKRLFLRFQQLPLLKINCRLISFHRFLQQLNL